MTTYHWPGFRLEFDQATGRAVTRYPDGTHSGCGVVEADRFHARLLGLTPEEHRLQHELAHHLVGALYSRGAAGGCPIIYRDAHGVPQPQPEADILEWRITALQYHSRGRRYDEGRIGALIDIEKAGADPYELAALLGVLMAAAQVGLESVTLGRLDYLEMESAA
jgi:hypothetical protein